MFEQIMADILAGNFLTKLDDARIKNLSECSAEQHQKILLSIAQTHKNDPQKAIEIYEILKLLATVSSHSNSGKKYFNLYAKDITNQPTINAFHMGVIQQCDKCVFKLLIKSGMSINTPGLISNSPWPASVKPNPIYSLAGEMLTPLELAIELKSEETIDILIELGANVNKGSHDKNPLYRACLASTSILEKIIKAGADLNSSSYQNPEPTSYNPSIAINTDTPLIRLIQGTKDTGPIAGTRLKDDPTNAIQMLLAYVDSGLDLTATTRTYRAMEDELIESALDLVFAYEAPAHEIMFRNARALVMNAVENSITNRIFGVHALLSSFIPEAFTSNSFGKIIEDYIDFDSEAAEFSALARNRLTERLQASSKFAPDQLMSPAAAAIKTPAVSTDSSLNATSSALTTPNDHKIMIEPLLATQDLRPVRKRPGMYTDTSNSIEPTLECIESYLRELVQRCSAAETPGEDARVTKIRADWAKGGEMFFSRKPKSTLTISVVEDDAVAAVKAGAAAGSAGATAIVSNSTTASAPAVNQNNDGYKL